MQLPIRRLLVQITEIKWRCCAIPIILGNIFNNLHQYTASQDVVQRYQASDSMDETKKSLWTNGVLALISAPIFYGMGTMMYSFYQHEQVLPKGFNTSSIVPYFILTEMPPFVGGLLIAAIFAAAQSTISSSLNSILLVFLKILNIVSSEKGQINQKLTLHD